MDSKFASAIERLHPSLDELVRMGPIVREKLPGDRPLSGIYLFSEGERHLYVGRSRNMRRRYDLHTRKWADENQASFAFRLAREVMGVSEADKDDRKLSRKVLLQKPDFREAFTKAKEQVSAMSFRYVEEPDPTKQAFLEIYCAVALETPHNDFDTH